MKEVLLTLFKSKKFLATLVGIVATLAIKVGVKLGIPLDPTEVRELTMEILGLIGIFVIGQGIADNGKGAVQAEGKKDGGA